MPGKIADISQPLGIECMPKISHEEGAGEPLRFYVQIKDEEDITMLVILSTFRVVMKYG